MIETLTKDQEARFPEFIKKWTDIGLDTSRSNRALAEQYCRDAYVIAGLNPPKIIFWAESPMGLLLTAKLVKEISKKGYKPYSVMDTASVWDSVMASVINSVMDSVWASVMASVRASVINSVMTSVSDSVWGSVINSVWDSVSDSVRDSVRDSVMASVMDSVRDSVMASVRASVINSVMASVSDSVSDSVMAGVWDSVRDSGLKNEWGELGSYGQHDSGWISFYDFFKEVCGLDFCKKLDPLSNLAKETGWHLFYKDIAILSEKPTELNRDTQGRLHNFNGAAIKWADGYELHRIHGIRLDKSKWICEIKKEEFTKDMILSEQNADFRRCIIQKIGIEKTIELLGADIVDTYESKVGGKYELLMIDYDGRGVKRPYLKMRSNSIAAYHIEGVDPKVKTVKEAIMYRNGLKKFVEPEVLT